jgi:hypothetical protein
MLPANNNRSAKRNNGLVYHLAGCDLGNGMSAPYHPVTITPDQALAIAMEAGTRLSKCCSRLATYCCRGGFRHLSFGRASTDFIPQVGQRTRRRSPLDGSPIERPASERTAAGEQKNDARTVPSAAIRPHVDSVFALRSVQQSAPKS